MGPHDLDGVARKCSKSPRTGRYLRHRHDLLDAVHDRDDARGSSPPSAGACAPSFPSAIVAPRPRARQGSDHQEQRHRPVDVPQRRMHDRSRDDQHDDRDERGAERPFQGHAEHPGQRRDDDDPASDAEETGQQARRRRRPARASMPAWVALRARSLRERPRRIWIDCHARSTAVTRSRSRALTTSVSRAPTAEAAAPVSEIHAAALRSTSPARWYVNAPTVAVGRITGRGVATATIGATPVNAVSPGVITIPPPMPNETREDARREADEHGEDRLQRSHGAHLPRHGRGVAGWLEP